MILYYVHDPMCSWCWGFRPTWEKIRSNLPKEVELTYLLGGLAPDSDMPMPDSMQKDIAGYWRKIQSHIPGTAFNFDFWDECEARRSTYPACRAIIAARKQNPEIELKMIEAVQTAYYLNAQNPSNESTLVAVAESLGLDGNVFSLDINSSETQKRLEAEIQLGQKIGAQGFPGMILEVAGKYYTVPLNYNDSMESLDFINKF